MWFWGWFLGLGVLGALARQRFGLLDTAGLREQSLNTMIGIGVVCFLVTLGTAVGQISAGESPAFAGLFCAASAWLVITPALELIRRAANGSRSALQAEVSRQIEARKSADKAAAASVEAAHNVAEARAAMRAADAALSEAVRQGRSLPQEVVAAQVEQSGPEETAAPSIGPDPQEVPIEPEAAKVSIAGAGSALELDLASAVGQLKVKKKAVRSAAAAKASKSEANEAASAMRQAAASADLQPVHPLQRPVGPISLGGSLPSRLSGGERFGDASTAGRTKTASAGGSVPPTPSGSRFSYSPQLVKSRLSGAAVEEAGPLKQTPPAQEALSKAPIRPSGPTNLPKSG